MTMRSNRYFFFIFLGVLFIGLLVWRLSSFTSRSVGFNGQRAYQDVITQVAFGPRIPESQAHAKTVSYIQEELLKANWKVSVQNTSWRGFSVENIIASHSNQTPEIVIGAHYDSRMLADQDQGLGHLNPVPGANDGASGVAILLELARTLPIENNSTGLVFFDAEDNGELAGRDWIMGSRAYVAELKYRPSAVIIVDMVGDKDLNIYMERNSNTTLSTEIWEQAAKLGYGKQFIPTIKYSMLDDHTPFLEAGIPAVDIIDFDYPFWHTSADTPDKVSPKSLQTVGETLRVWINLQK